MRNYFLILLFLSSMPALAGVGMINSFKGEASLIHQGNKVPAKIGASIEVGDDIVVGAGSSAQIIMTDKNVFTINENSHLLIQGYDAGPKPSADLKMEGRVHSSIHQTYDDQESTFRLSTPTAVAGVRGTEFLTEHEGEETRVTTFSGNVQVGSGLQGKKIINPVMVGPGMQSVAARGQSPKPATHVSDTHLAGLRDQSSKGHLTSTSSKTLSRPTSHKPHH